MLPKKEFTSDLNFPPEEAKSELENLIGESKTLSLNSTFAAGGSSFRLSTKKTFSRFPFGRQVILAEINGEVKDSVIQFRIRLRPLMSGILLIDSLILLVIVYESFDSGQTEQGFLLLCFALITLIFCYFLYQVFGKRIEKN